MIGTKILEQKDSKYNGTVTVIKSWGYGTYLQVGGLTQSGGVVETIWKQTLKNARKDKFQADNALILGLGGGTVAGGIKTLWPGSRIVGVEIDPVMIELGKKYLGLEGLVTEIEIADAKDFILKNKSHFDLVIVDVYQGDSYPESFESEKLLYKLKNILAENGLIIFNRLYFGEKIAASDAFEKKLRKIFPSVTHFYPSANIMFFCKT